jgi:queuine tRNA-ribosyltransferase
MSFKLIKTSKKSKARLGKISTLRGDVETPYFMPIATLGSVKSLDKNELEDMGTQMILGNTYHLFLQPGKQIINKAKGLHNFMNWDKPILTDSGGYQVFSLGKLRKITEKGVIFNSHIDGSKHMISPEISIDFQTNILKSDIVMSFDECPAFPSTKKYHAKAMTITNNWAERGKRVFNKSLKDKARLRKSYGRAGQLLFGIVQGGTYKDLREKHTKEIVEIGFDGYALGGLAVGEPVEKMYKAINWSEPFLPKEKPRYLMGTGYPDQLVHVVKQGMDMFDCVIPTREARHGRLYLWNPNYKRGVFNKNFYKTIDITKSPFKTDMSPIMEPRKASANEGMNPLQGYSKAYLNHLFKAKEPLSIRLATLNNLHFYLTLMEDIRYAIKVNKL